jgi:NAD(P)-dependent dehydrogenase (short-subunit alcohol dehydrogenase family)
VRTEIISSLFKNKEDEKHYVKSKIPIGNIANPIDVAKAAMFLSSDDASHITGITMLIDGGMTLL